MKKNKKRQIDLSKVAGGIENSKSNTNTYNFNDSFDFTDEEGTKYLGNVDTKATITTTSYNLSDTTIKKGGALSELIKKMNKG